MMTRLEILVAAVLLVAVCTLSSLPSGFEVATVGAGDADPLGPLAPLRAHAFYAAAAAVTLLGILLEDGRRRELAKRTSDTAGPRPRSG